jgi:hypothetical protein
VKIEIWLRKRQKKPSSREVARTEADHELHFPPDEALDLVWRERVDIGERAIFYTGPAGVALALETVRRSLVPTQPQVSRHFRRVQVRYRRRHLPGVSPSLWAKTRVKWL